MERKSPEWIIANLLDDSGKELKDVSINKTSKKGEVFPNFDELMPGGDVSGELWTSPSGKNYLFPPRPEGSSKKPNMDRIIEKKQQGIAESQERKAQSIAQAQDRSAWMWAKNNASTLLASQGKELGNLDEISATVILLATKIYNGEPTEPF